MAIVQLDTENADRDLTSQVTVLTDTPNASNPVQCQAIVYLGDGTKDLDGSGGDFEMTVTVGGQTVEPDPQIISASTATRIAIASEPFTVPENDEVVIKVKSPNAADTDVDVTAYLYDVFPLNNSSGIVESNVKQVSDDSTAADNAESAFDGTGYDLGGIDVSELNGIVDDWIDAGRLDALVDAIKAKTDNLPASPAAVGSEMALEDDAITSAKYDETTAYPLESADSGSTEVARTGADSDTLEDISDEIAALNDLSAADVNAQVLDVLNVDTFAELASVPNAAATITQMIRWMYLKHRNKVIQTEDTQTIYADDEATSVATSAVSDDGTTATRGEFS